MGSNLNIESLLKLRNEVLDNILKSFTAWDETIERGIYIIETNKVDLDSINSINQKISILDNLSLYDEEYKNKLQIIIRKQKSIIGFIRMEQKKLLDGISQLSKRKVVVNNYLKTDKTSIFIDKDL